MPCHKAQIISNWFLEHDNEFTVLQWPPQLPDIDLQEIRIMDVQPPNLQQLRDALMTIWKNMENLWGMFPAPC